jgi:hypothetical protein
MLSLSDTIVMNTRRPNPVPLPLTLHLPSPEKVLGVVAGMTTIAILFQEESGYENRRMYLFVPGGLRREKSSRGSVASGRRESRGY